jgi:DNA-binding transcriptional regulator GbsR (MarR family)
MNRTVAQIHALLLVSDRPLTADEIKSALSVARSNVSVSLRELLNWGLVTTVQVMGDRKKRFEAQKDIKVMFRQIMIERKKREVDAVVQCFGQCAASLKAGALDAKTQKKVDELTDVFKKLDSFYGQLIKNI